MNTINAMAIAQSVTDAVMEHRRKDDDFNVNGMEIESSTGICLRFLETENSLIVQRTDDFRVAIKQFVKGSLATYENAIFYGVHDVLVSGVADYIKLFISLENFEKSALNEDECAMFGCMHEAVRNAADVDLPLHARSLAASAYMFGYDHEFIIDKCKVLEYNKIKREDVLGWVTDRLNDFYKEKSEECQ